MAQHPCVARLYDEHTQAVHNSPTPVHVSEAMKLASDILFDGRALAGDYERLQIDYERAVVNTRMAAHAADTEKADRLTMRGLYDLARGESTALREALLLYVDEFGSDCMHDDPGCPEDDTCTCPTVKKIEKALAGKGAEKALRERELARDTIRKAMAYFVKFPHADATDLDAAMEAIDKYNALPA